MSDESRVAVAEYDDASKARAASRALLAAGITPSVRVDGERRFVEVSADAAREAGRLLGGSRGPSTPPESNAPGNLSDDGESIEASSSSIDGRDAKPAGDPPPIAAETAEGPTALATGSETIPDEHEGLPPTSAEPHTDRDGFAAVALVSGQEAADTMAATLVESGIGSRCVPAHEHGYASVIMDADSMVVQVLAEQAPRALSLLGIEPPQPLPSPTGDTATASDEAGRTKRAQSSVNHDNPEHSGAAAGHDASRTGGLDAATTPADRSGTAVRSAKKADSDEVRSYLGGRVKLTRRQLTVAIIVYLAALVLVPLAFFYGTQWILTPDVADPMTTLPEVPGR